MKIFVCIKQTPDTEAVIAPRGPDIDESAVNKWVLNPYDEFAVEEAVKLKEQLGDAEVIAVSLGPDRAKSAFQTALAMGADRGIHIVSENVHDAAQTARALAKAIQMAGTPDVVFTGVQAIDDNACQVHLRLAHHLDASAAINVSSFAWTEEGAEVMLNAGGGSQETRLLHPPAVVAVTKDINKPRYPTLPNIMKAKKKPIQRIAPGEVELGDASAAMETLSLELPEEVFGGKVLEGDCDASVSELVTLLKNEAKAI